MLEIQTAVAERVPPLRSSVGTGPSDMADLPGGVSEILRRDYKCRRADQLVTRSAPGVVALLAELRGADPGVTWIAGT